MKSYDPQLGPDPAEWNSLDEGTRISLVIEHHRSEAVELPDEEMHAVIHVVVENQIAGKDERVRKVLDRLICEGLDRHDAIHAIGSVLAGYIHELLERTSSGSATHERYFRRLDELTAEHWLKGTG